MSKDISIIPLPYATLWVLSISSWRFSPADGGRSVVSCTLISSEGFRQAALTTIPPSNKNVILGNPAGIRLSNGSHAVALGFGFVQKNNVEITFNGPNPGESADLIIQSWTQAIRGINGEWLAPSIEVLGTVD